MIQVTIGPTSSGLLSPPIIAAMISGLVALITGTVVAVFAWRQWRTAKDKLALDLFDRRLANFRTWHAAYQERAHLLTTWNALGTPLNEVRTPSSELDTAIADARFLFGSRIHDELHGLESLMNDWSGALGTRGDSHANLGKQARRRLRQLEEDVEPYMMLDAIAVNRPARRRDGTRRRSAA